MNLIIRSDANANIGIGHVMRCIALGQAWKDLGGDVTFLCCCERKILRQRIIEEGFHFIPINKAHPDPDDLYSTLELLSANQHAQLAKSPWLVLDGYHFTTNYQKTIRKNGYKLLIIDDMAHLDHYYANIILNQNIHASGLHYSCQRETIKLLGCKYVLLRKEFIDYKVGMRKIPDKANKILVTLGGEDSENVTLKVIKALNSLNDPDFEVKVVIGPANLNIDKLDNEIQCSSFKGHLVASVNRMPEFMAWADLAISGGGSTCWEMAFFGLPFLTIVLAENQESIATGLFEKGVSLDLGWHDKLSIERISRCLQDIIYNQNIREIFSSKGQQLLNGNGSKKVADVIYRDV